MVINLGGGSKEETRLLWRLAGMGFQFGTEIIAGVLLGWFVDRVFRTAPWGVVIGAVAGILVAMMHFIRQAMRLNREMDRNAPVRKHRAAPPIQQQDSDSDQLLKQQEQPEEELTQEQWNKLRDSELEPNPDDDER